MTTPGFVNPWNPSPAEVRGWAYDAAARDPCQDFDLALRWCRPEKVLFECAADERCPKRDFFLRVLYLIVGDAVRSGYRSTERPIIEGLIERGDSYRHPDIQKWQERSRDLMEHPDKFDYTSWCAGGLVLADRG